MNPYDRTTAKVYAYGVVMHFDRSGLIPRDQIIRMMKEDAQKKIREYQAILATHDDTFEVIQDSTQYGRTYLAPRPHPQLKTPTAYINGHTHPVVPGHLVNTGTLKANTISANSLSWSGVIGNLGDTEDWYTPLLPALEMKALEFTDLCPGFWYFSSTIDTDILLEVSIDKNSGEYDVDVIDESTASPVQYGTLPDSQRDDIIRSIDKVLSAFSEAGLSIKIDHEEYGYVPAKDQA